MKSFVSLTGICTEQCPTLWTNVLHLVTYAVFTSLAISNTGVHIYLGVRIKVNRNQRIGFRTLFLQVQMEYPKNAQILTPAF